MRSAICFLVISLTACSPSPGTSDPSDCSPRCGDAEQRDGGTSSDGGTGDAGEGADPGGEDDAGAGSGASDAGQGSDDAGPSANDGGLAIGEWTDAPGQCPAGMTPISLRTLSDLQEATRGEGARAGDPASSCYLIEDGTYAQSNSVLPMYVKLGGTSASVRRLFIGKSRAGVVIRGRASIGDGVNHVTLQNLSFDLTGYSQSGSFNTLSLGNGTDIQVDHVTFTGDCQTGALGGHIETNGTHNVTISSCLIERFGRCGPQGHLEHGIYLASGAQIAIVNNVIRQNASRGIQLYTADGAYGTLDGITIRQNRIEANGHANYEDGIAINGSGTGTISNVTIEHNILAGNYYSGVRSVGAAQQAIVIRKNTFYRNSVGSTASGGSELNLDAAGSGAQTLVTRNLIVADRSVLNDCYDAAARGYALTDNYVPGRLPSGAAANCISQSVGLGLDPQFAALETGDYRALAAGAVGYGAYAP